DTWTAALFAMSAEVEDATGAPASVVGVATDLFLALGKQSKAFVNPNYGTQNVAGTASASNLRINVNGLEIDRWRFLAAGKAVVTNESAAKFAETGALLADAENVVKLGRDVAVWGMYEDAEISFPTGVRTLTGVVPPIGLLETTEPTTTKTTRGK